jgi:DNA helicase II / ATP-dependent DNA helicase PcrA
MRTLALRDPEITLRAPMANLSSLNPQQRLAAETVNGPVLILAGAGTGKTRVITYRIAHLIAKGVAPENILAVTFTNKAAREMQERVNKLLPNLKSRNRDTKAPPRPTICTFHSLCVRILRQHIERLGYKRNFVIYDESEQLAAVKKILSSISAKGEKTDPFAILALLGKFKNGGESSAAFADPSVRALAEHIRTRYESALRACNAVDFDDLILLTLRLFNEFPEVLEACRAKYRHVMADEYQDTNATQFQLIHALTLKHRNLCVVGDDDQSIYGWRGAEIANLLDLEKYFPEVKIVKLEQNYRSTNTILTAANALIKNNARRRAKQLWSQKGQGQKILLRACSNEDEEATEVVGQIEFARLAHRVPWKENAILFRTNIQSRPIETALRKAGIRYHLIGGQSFFDRREIRDFLAYLKTFINPHDDISLLRIANTPARGLSDVTMERLLATSQERHCSVFAAMKNPLVQAMFQKRTQECLEAFAGFIERTRAALQSGTGFQPVSNNNLYQENRLEACSTLKMWADKFLDESGYLNELRRQEKDAETGDLRIRNLRELTATLDGNFPAGKAPFERLENFLEEITLDSEREDEEEKGDVVTLITMHSCKGLEFPHVFIVGMEDGLLPHTRSTTEGTLDEERRLFYVAVTRAMLTLTISHCASRTKYGQSLPCHPSRFLKELPAELVEHAEAKDKRPVNQEIGKSLFNAMREAVG